jgi:hypothetical protein
MSRPLVVRRVRLDGPAVPHSWAFPAGVTVIVGAVGGGKTSLLNLVKFALGGNAPVTDTITGAASSVTLDIEIGARSLQLTRDFSHRSTVTVQEGDRPQRRYGVRRQARDPWLSDLLLEALGIPSIEVRQSRTGRSTKVTSISFLDVFAYCYLDQDQVDRSTVFDNDRFIGPKRAWTFELLHGIVDRDLAAMEVASVRTQEELNARRERVDVVERFVDEKGLAMTSDLIRARLAEIGTEERRLEAELAVARDSAERGVAATANAGEEIAKLEQQTAAARAEYEQAVSELAGVQRAANQLERDLLTLTQGDRVRAELEPLSYEVCPRCEQSLERRPLSAAQCVVCLQPEPASVAEPRDVMASVEAQLAETRGLLSSLADARDSAAAVVGDLSASLSARREEARRLAVAAAAPHLEQAAHLQERLGALRGERTALVEAQPLTRAVAVEHEEIQAARPRVAALEDKAAERRQLLAPARERVEELSEAFDEILRRFTLPWLETAEVDRTTYLPRVNGRSLRDLSSAGMKATTNVAYYLAVLVTALRDREVLTPSFLMLDGFRKDYGADAKDLARAERIYDYLRTLQVSRSNPGALAADFQLIVVDNDLPPDFRRAFNTIHIDPDEPLIREG